MRRIMSQIKEKYLLKIKLKKRKYRKEYHAYILSDIEAMKYVLIQDISRFYICTKIIQVHSTHLNILARSLQQTTIRLCANNSSNMFSVMVGHKSVVSIATNLRANMATFARWTCLENRVAIIFPFSVDLYFSHTYISN